MHPKQSSSRQALNCQSEQRRRLRMELLETRCLLAASAFMCEWMDLQTDVGVSDSVETDVAYQSESGRGDDDDRKRDRHDRSERPYVGGLRGEGEGPGESGPPRSGTNGSGGGNQPDAPTSDSGSSGPTIGVVLNPQGTTLGPSPVHPGLPQAGPQYLPTPITPPAETQNQQSPATSQPAIRDNSLGSAFDFNFDVTRSNQLGAASDVGSELLNNSNSLTPSQTIVIGLDHLGRGQLSSSAELRGAAFEHLFSDGEQISQLRELDELIDWLSVEANNDVGTTASGLLQRARAAAVNNSLTTADYDAFDRALDAEQLSEMLKHEGGMIALQLPDDLLPSRSDALKEDSAQIAAWTADIGVYRDSELPLANGAKAVVQQPTNASRAADLTAREEVSEEIVAFRLRPILAATSVALGTIFIGFRRQKQHDLQVQQSFEKLN